MIAESIVSFVSEALSDSGFSPVAVYSPQKLSNVVFPAIWRIKRIDLSDYVNGLTPECRSDVTVHIRACGNKKDFSDIEELYEKVGELVSELIFSSAVSVKSVALGKASPDMNTRRLEYPVEAVFSLPLEKGD